MGFLAVWLAKYAFGRWLQTNWRLVLVGLAALAVLLAAWWAVDAIGDAREEKVVARYEAAQRAAEAKARDDEKALQTDIAKIDTTTIQTVEKIRYVPRDKPRTIAVEVARDLPCLSVPDRLREATNQYTRDLAATAGHRLDGMSAAGAAEGR